MVAIWLIFLCFLEIEYIIVHFGERKIKFSRTGKNAGKPKTFVKYVFFDIFLCVSFSSLLISSINVLPNIFAKKKSTVIYFGIQIYLSRRSEKKKKTCTDIQAVFNDRRREFYFFFSVNVNY